MDLQSLRNGFMTLTVVVGALCLAVAAASFPVEKVDIYFVTLFALTLGIGSRVSVKIPRIKSHIAVSDTFVFLALLLYGGPAAIVLSACEAFLSSWRFCNKKITVLFNSATVAISTTGAIFMLRVLDVYTEEQLHGRAEKVDSFLIALCTLALAQFLINTSLAAIYDSLNSSVALLETWKRKYVWSFLTYFIGAAGAGLLVQLSDGLGFGVIIAAFPIIVFVFLTYRMYLQNVEMSVQQADQANEYARILQKQQTALVQSEERFRTAFHYAPIGIGLALYSGGWIKVNHALCTMFGFSETEFLRSDFRSLLLADDSGHAMSKIDRVLSGKLASCRVESRSVHKHGKTLWTLWSVSAVTDSRSGEPSLIVQIQDITDTKLAEEKLQYEATHDALTRLPNRAHFLRRLGGALERAQDSGTYDLGVLFIDLDRFKDVNDTLGHHAGDELLVQIAQRLTSCVRPADMVARLGGDEFVIVVEDNARRNEVVNIAERIKEKFSEPFYLGGSEIYSSASIGVLYASESHVTPEDVMRDADTAMYRAKRAGSGRHHVFEEQVEVTIGSFEN